jgi:predicted aspartyl protease
VLALPWFNRDYAVLADGTITWFEMYLAVIDWEGLKRQISVQAVDAQPLIGTDLLLGHDLRIRMTDGGPVTIAAIP